MKIDLSVGNPSFLFDYWRAQDLPEDNNIYYPSSYSEGVIGHGLEKAIRATHAAIGNVKNLDEYHVVIANGASQLLYTAMHEMDDHNGCWAKAPHYQRFPVLSQIAGSSWTSDPGHQTVTILTIPNNPTGDSDFKEYDKRPIIVDACYNWPQYGPITQLDHDAQLFSLSKSTGHAGTRLGWALIKDKEMADRMRQSIEFQTMGVCDLAQEVGRFVLMRESTRFSRGDENVFSWGNQEINKRWARIRAIEDKLPFSILNNRGMFLWCLGDIPEAVEGFTGERFGDSPNKFRLNLGCSIYHFNLFMSDYEDEDDRDE